MAVREAILAAGGIMGVWLLLWALFSFHCLGLDYYVISEAHPVALSLRGQEPCYTRWPWGTPLLRVPRSWVDLGSPSGIFQPYENPDKMVRSVASILFPWPNRRRCLLCVHRFLNPLGS